MEDQAKFLKDHSPDSSNRIRGSWNPPQVSGEGMSGCFYPVAMSTEELKIRKELEMEVEKQLEQELKGNICQLALSLHHLYQNQRQRSNKDSITVGDAILSQTISNTCTELKIIIKMGGKSNKMEIHEVKQASSDKHMTTRGREKDWAKSLRSSLTLTTIRPRNEKLIPWKPWGVTGSNCGASNGKDGGRKRRNMTIAGENKKLLLLGWKN